MAYFSLLRQINGRNLNSCIAVWGCAYNNNHFFKVAVISLNTGWHCCCSGPLQFAAALILYIHTE